eukprot:2083581-Rhodomonas_salina.1
MAFAVAVAVAVAVVLVFSGIEGGFWVLGRAGALAAAKKGRRRSILPLALLGRDKDPNHVPGPYLVAYLKDPKQVPTLLDKGPYAGTWTLPRHLDKAPYARPYLVSQTLDTGLFGTERCCGRVVCLRACSAISGPDLEYCDAKIWFFSCM